MARRRSVSGSTLPCLRSCSTFSSFPFLGGSGRSLCVARHRAGTRGASDRGRPCSSTGAPRPRQRSMGRWARCSPLTDAAALRQSFEAPSRRSPAVVRAPAAAMQAMHAIRLQVAVLAGFLVRAPTRPISAGRLTPSQPPVLQFTRSIHSMRNRSSAKKRYKMIAGVHPAACGPRSLLRRTIVLRSTRPTPRAPPPTSTTTPTCGGCASSCPTRRRSTLN